MLQPAVEEDHILVADELAEARAERRHPELRILHSLSATTKLRFALEARVRKLLWKSPYMHA